MKNNKSDLANRRIAFIGSIVSILLVAAVGFAYFSATVVNTNNERLSTETSTLSLKFEDSDSGISGTLNLGESITKKFTIQNTGTLDAYAKINWYNLVNTYMTGSLTYNLEQSTSENGTYTSIDSSNVPVSSTETTETLKNGILVPVNTTYYYKLTITFNNLENVNQNSDINASFYSYFSLEEGSLSGVDKIKNLVAGADTSSTNVITKESPAGSTCTNTLAYDGTVDNNLRYVGKNPCNYVSFNGEAPTTGEKWIMIITSTGQDSGMTFDTQEACQAQYDEWIGQGMPENYYTCQSKTLTTGGWRIIGVMNNVDDGTGKKETRIKLVRNDSLGNYSWDTSESSVNYGYGVNDWTQADLMQELNGDYLNTSLTANTMWYNGSSNQKTGEFDITKRLKARAQAQIGEAKWHLGGTDSNTYSQDATGAANNFYNYERGITVWGSSTGQTCNDGACPRATEWTGKVALIYPSDYGYAVGGEVRSTCLGKSLYNYNTENCGTNDYLRPAGGWSWTLSPSSYSSYRAFYVTSDGSLDNDDTNIVGAVSPAVYLKSEVSISSGNGSESEPYVLG